jgi:hypothetical protein
MFLGFCRKCPLAGKRGCIFTEGLFSNDWYSSISHKKPKDRQSVVISFGGIFRLATYDSKMKVFKLKSQPYIEFKLFEPGLAWTEFSAN